MPARDQLVLPASGGDMLQIVSGTGDLTGDLEMFLSLEKNLYAPLVTIAITLDGIGSCTNANWHGTGRGYHSSYRERRS